MATIDLLNPTFRRYPVRGFGGGINKAVSSFQLNDDELIDAKNVQFGFKGSFSPRLGTRRYDDSSGDNVGATRRFETRNITRYTKSDSTREMLIQADRYVYADNDTSVFADVVDLNTSDDGLIRFASWRDTLYFSTENDSSTQYHRDEATSETHTSSMQPIAKNILIFSGVLSTGGQLEASRRYYYRFTLDIQAGNDFLGETAPLISDLGTDPKFYEQFFSDTDATNKTITVKPLNGNKNQIPTWAKRLNIYRTLDMSTSDSIQTTDKDTTLYFWKSIDIDDLTVAGVVDDGTVAVDTSRPLFYNLLDDPPKSRFVVPHKNRMWYLYQEDNRARVYFSEYGQPEVVRPTSFFDINTNDGEPITGAVSWRKSLYVFKINSIHTISGGDIENAPGVPDIQIDPVDDPIGCIAPLSLARGEGGLIFLSNRGVEFFNGTRPIPLNSELIRPILEEIPGSMRSRPAGVYIQKKRLYRLSMANNTLNPGKNSLVVEFDFFSKTWTRHEYGTGSNPYGINAWLETRLGDEVGQVYAVNDTVGLVQATTIGAVGLYDDVSYEIATDQGIAWEAQMKFFDCGLPDIEKTFRAIIVRLSSGQAVTLSWDIDEGAGTGSGTISHTGTHSWDEANLSWRPNTPTDTTTHVWDDIDQGERVFLIPQTVKGRRISPKFTGTSTMEGTEIQGLTIIYTAEGRLRD